MCHTGDAGDRAWCREETGEVRKLGDVPQDKPPTFMSQTWQIWVRQLWMSQQWRQTPFCHPVTRRVAAHCHIKSELSGKD